MLPLLISEIFPPRTGGSGRWLWEIYRRLPRGGCVVAAGEDPRQEEFDGTHRLNVVRMPLSLSAWGIRSWRGLAGYTSAFRRLRRLVRQTTPDRVHAARVLPEGLMAWLLKRWFGLPYLCYVHGEEITCTSESRELLWLARRVVSGAELLIANSRNTVEVVQGVWGAKPEKVRLLHPGVDANVFRPAPRDLKIRERLGWGSRPVVLTVGRLQKRKGHDQMILALNAVRRKVPNALYAIVGEGEERGALEQLVAREGLAGRVLFMGECDDEDLVACYQQCDVFVLPNRTVGRDIEGFGMVLLEAQACGKPVIAGASGGTAETMSIPLTGQVVDCSNPATLGYLVGEWLANPLQRFRMGEAARKWAAEGFDWSVLTPLADSLFRNGREPCPGDAPRVESQDAAAPGLVLSSNPVPHGMRNEV
jgi:phosphatidylinositol alpha-1,6-mannosyltransferase